MLNYNYSYYLQIQPISVYGFYSHHLQNRQNQPLVLQLLSSKPTYHCFTVISVKP
jgi:hypothetical protein